MDTQTAINNCKIEDNIIKLPSAQLERNTYVEVANKLKKIGGKWKGGRIQGFVFDHNPTDLLADLQNGKERNIKKEFQFFETPVELAKRIISLAEIQSGSLILEPSAGRGAIIQQIPRGEACHFYEINPQLQEFLTTINFGDSCGFCSTWDTNFQHSRTCPNNDWLSFLGADFLSASETIKYDRIVANPPFSKNQDIDHIRKMYAVLATDGIMVSIASTHYKNSNNRKETQFRNWLSEVKAEVFEVGAGAFKESGTNIETVIIRIRK